MAEGLRGERADADRENSALRERLFIIETHIAEKQNQLSKLLDLYLGGGFPKDVLADRRMRIEREILDLEREHIDLSAHLEQSGITDEQIEVIESFCSEVRIGLENATFEDKRRYFDLLVVRCKLAVENGEKVAYLRCKLGEQRLSLALTSP